MLILMQRAKDKIHIGDSVEIVVRQIGNGEVQLGIKAPQWMKIQGARFEKYANNSGNRLQPSNTGINNYKDKNAYRNPMDSKRWYEISE